MIKKRFRRTLKEIPAPCIYAFPSIACTHIPLALRARCILQPQSFVPPHEQTSLSLLAPGATAHPIRRRRRPGLLLLLRGRRLLLALGFLRSAPRLLGLGGSSLALLLGDGSFLLLRRRFFLLRRRGGFLFGRGRLLGGRRFRLLLGFLGASARFGWGGRFGFLRVGLALRAGFFFFVARVLVAGLGFGAVFLLLFVVLGRTAGCFLFDFNLALALYDIVAWSRNMQSWVVGGGVLLDRVAFLRLDREFAFGFLLDDFAGGTCSAPLPRNCSCQTDQIGSDSF